MEKLGEFAWAIRSLEAQFDGSTDDERPEAVEWSRPESVEKWAKVFGFSRNTMTQRFQEGTPRNKKMGRFYMVALDDLPAAESAKYRAPRGG
jgi:hypothetical protein